MTCYLSVMLKQHSRRAPRTLDEAAKDAAAQEVVADLRKRVVAAFSEQLREFRKQLRVLTSEHFSAPAQGSRGRLVKVKGVVFRKRAVAGEDSAAQATQRYRDRMRSQGMKLVQLWVPDPEAPGYRQECQRQSALIAKAAADATTDEAAMNRALAAHADEVLAGEPDYDWGPEGPPK
jgi:hypothetical protein